MFNKSKYIVVCGLILLSISSIALAQSKLIVHGHLSQAFAISDGHQIFGIPEEGTFDYRNLALQFRYDINENNSSVIQFSHRRIGESPLMELESDVVLDWAFFEHKLNNNIGVKFGKILIPFGVYNEIRDVGILIPFYRVPFTPYSMGSYISETVNGISAYYTGSMDDWEFTFDVYAGNWQWKLWFNQSNPLDGSVIPILDVSNVENGGGARFDVSIPYENMNGGLSWQRGDVSGEYFFGTKFGGVREQNFNMVNLYLDINYEILSFKPEITKILCNPGNFYIDGVSVFAGLEIYNGLSANFSYEMINIIDIPDYESEDSNIIEDRESSDYLRDFAVGLNYSFTSNVILKSEIHFNRSLAFEDVYANVFSDNPKNIKYFVLSLATSF